MKISRLLMEAIRALPAHLVQDQTRLAVIAGTVVMANPAYALMLYDADRREWSMVEFANASELV